MAYFLKLPVLSEHAVLSTISDLLVAVLQRQEKEQNTTEEW